MNISRWISQNAASRPQGIAVMMGQDPVLTHAELAKSVAQRGAWLSSHGLKPGGRVAMFMGNSPSFVETFYAVLWAGGVVVPINAKLHASELAVILSDASPVAVFVDRSHREVGAMAVSQLDAEIHLFDAGSPEISKAIAECQPKPIVPRADDDLAWLFFTSGTTGRPKGAMLSHSNLRLMAESYLAEVDPVHEHDSILHAAPMSHGSGMYMIPFTMRGACQIIPASGGFDEAEIATICANRNGISFFAAPTMVHRLLQYFQKPENAEQTPGLLAGLKLIVYGGGTMLLETARQARAVFGTRLAQIYGQAECPMTISRLQSQTIQAAEGLAGDRRLSSVGQPFGQVEVKIAGASNAGDVGEILVRSPLVMTGYWNAPDASADTLCGDWLHTGDIGHIDCDGYLHLTDRAKDVIISGGTNIYSREVEDVLIQHPSVEEAAVVGKPSQEWGEDVAAFVVVREDGAVTPEELDAHCLTSLARFKRPKVYYFVTTIPKNAYGKVDKAVLRSRL